MKLENFGYNDKVKLLVNENNHENFEIGRIVLEHKERYIVKTEKGDLEAEITGNMRFSAKSREDFPAVGDWVGITIYDSDFAIINKVMPRFSVITRQAVGQFGEVQIIATNIDYAFLVQAIDRDFNINRLERYLTICNASKVSPIIVLTKTDLIEKQSITGIVESIKLRIDDVPVIALSNQTQDGYESIYKIIEKGKTYCMLGSSGVGKSTLINNLSGRSLMKTDAISESTNKGRHTTTHRELIILENGGIFIDNPGMREAGITDSGNGLETTFDKIISYGANCRFKDCSHKKEAGCAVIEAVENGEIDRDSYINYMKMEKEKAFFELTVVEKRKRDKNFGKMVKSFKKFASGK